MHIYSQGEPKSMLQKFCTGMVSRTCRSLCVTQITKLCIHNDDKDVALDLEGYHIDKPAEKAAGNASVHEQKIDTKYPIVSTSHPPSSSRTPQPCGCVLYLL